MIQPEEVNNKSLTLFQQVEYRVKLVQQANKLKTACKRLLYDLDQSNTPLKLNCFRQAGVHKNRSVSSTTAAIVGNKCRNGRCCNTQKEMSGDLSRGY